MSRAKTKVKKNLFLTPRCHPLEQTKFYFPSGGFRRSCICIVIPDLISWRCVIKKGHSCLHSKKHARPYYVMCSPTFPSPMLVGSAM